MEREELLLTKFTHGAGCGCKIAPAMLREILTYSITDAAFANLLVGNESADDAAVYDMGNNDCLISTTDFFLPIVDDPIDFGRIAAANALSDVYAMGGTPIMALAILGWPVEKLPVELVQKILQGGRSVCNKVGIPLAGGHSIDSTEPIFGLSVNGVVKKQHIKRNNTAKAGDQLFLTKPIGTGILATALKRKLISAEEMRPAVDVMCSLNTIGSAFGKQDYVHAITDVTGFGLLGHLLEMCEGSNLDAELFDDAIKIIDGVDSLAKQFVAPDNTFRNWKSYEQKTEGITGERLVILCDPQTSGGLLVAVDPSYREKFIEIMIENNLTEYIKPIGVMKESKGEKRVAVI
ncbi:MAG: selenide, water dikinase SelD [Chitinophagales bacterium]|jgi:selenide,water dikinase|nr:selenide, water dikinase SelD [Chitinophagales bacterium]